jgi:D-alanyl-D-alanine carboxypeptidase
VVVDSTVRWRRWALACAVVAIAAVPVPVEARVLPGTASPEGSSTVPGGPRYSAPADIAADIGADIGGDAGGDAGDGADDGPSLACTGEVEQVRRPGRHWDAVVVDPIRRLPEAWAPRDLRDVSHLGYRGRPGVTVRDHVVAPLEQMHADAAASGARFVVVSGFRSQEEQARLWDQAQADDTAGTDLHPGTAHPGHSEHQLGTTIDVVDPSLPRLVHELVDTPAGRWLADNAASYGFVVTYPEGASAITCFKPEPWHLRYVGVERAVALEASGLTLREFLLGR